MVKNVNVRIDRIEEGKGYLSSFCSLVKHCSLNTQETDSQHSKHLKSPGSIELMDFSFDGTGKTETVVEEEPLT